MTDYDPISDVWNSVLYAYSVIRERKRNGGRGWIPMKADETHDWSKPDWSKPNSSEWEYCRICGIVRRADRNNKPCAGPSKVTLRGDSDLSLE